MNNWQYSNPEIFAEMFNRIVGNEFDDAWLNRYEDAVLKVGRFVIAKDDYDMFNVFDTESAQAIAFHPANVYDKNLITDLYTTAGDDYESLGKFLKFLAEELHKHNA